MRVDAASYADGGLVLKTSDPAARRFAYGFKPGEYEIVKAKKRRSLDANAMCWWLCSQIAEAARTTKEAVYIRAIKDIGEYTPLPIRADAVDAFAKVWGAHGTGWPVEVVDDSKLPGYKLVFAYHGSSVYDTKAMSRLIDYLIDEAKNVGIDTMSEAEKALLLEDWGKQSG